jgi:hypothetical protein
LKFAFISEEKVAFPIALLCRVLDVPGAGEVRDVAGSGRRPAFVAKTWF